jgi:hypothetical protein
MDMLELEEMCKMEMKSATMLERMDIDDHDDEDLGMMPV